MKKPSSQGFTLIEMMVTLTVAAVLLGIAVPSFVDVTNRNRVATSSNDYLTALNLVRSEAIKRALPIAICPANAALTACVASTNWATGWIAFTDEGATANVFETGETLLQAWPAPSGGVAITNTVTAVRFMRDGTRDGVVDPEASIVKSDQARCISVSQMGRSSLEKAACT